MIEPIASYTESIEFLKKWNPEGPWVITAIDPNKRGIETASFAAAEDKACELWMEQQGEKKKRNIYFTVNPVTRMLDKKPTREDIAALAWIHVDLDPRAGEDIGEEQKRILSLLKDPPGSVPPPTCITFSGGGYQGFWRLQEPLLLNGSPESYEEAKRFNKQIELELGGDNCHNVDRIMRVPGTINRPDARKRKKGRREARSRVIEWSKGSCPLAKFTKAPEVQGNSAPGFTGNTVQISGNIARFSSVDEIKELKEYPQCRVIIVQGKDPDDEHKFGSSRSEWLFFVCCEMVRAGCDDDTVYSVITDPDFMISDSVFNDSSGKPRGGSSTESYAIRQIERARERAIDPTLQELNDRHAVVTAIGSKGLCRILSEETDLLTQRPRVAFQSQADFLLRYRNRSVEVSSSDGKNTSFKPAGIWWLDHPLRREFDQVIFLPGKDTPGSYNLWKGFAYQATPGGSCDKYLEHVRTVICDGDEPSYQYLVRWMANAVQNPAEPGQVAIVLRGVRGAGKGVFAQAFGKIWGRHFLQVTDSKHLTGSFNAHMRDCVVMYADEAFAAQDRRAESLLKTLVTESMIITEAKGVDAEPSPNFIHLIMASNDQFVVPVGAYERRFCVLDVSKSVMQDSTYFTAINEELDAGGYEALLHFLMTMDLTDFDVRIMPRTDALRDQQEFSMAPEDEWWFDKLMSGEILDTEGWGQYVYCSHLHYDYIESMRSSPGARFAPTSTRLLKLLGRVTGGNIVKQQQKPNNPVDVVQKDGRIKEVMRPYTFEIPDLATCRSVWEELGGPHKWPSVPEQVEITYDEDGGGSEVWG